MNNGAAERLLTPGISLEGAFWADTAPAPGGRAPATAPGRGPAAGGGSDSG